MKSPTTAMAMVIIAALPLTAMAAAEGETRNRDPLPVDDVITLSVIEGGVTQVFSHVQAGRDFGVRFTDAKANSVPTLITLRARIEPRDNRGVCLSDEQGECDGTTC